MRPIVGITSYVEPASWGVWTDQDAALIRYSYIEAVTESGGRAVLLPPDDLDADVLRAVDALLLAGGADLGPDLYGEEPGPLTESRPHRDRGESTLLEGAFEADLPVLGICRGMQLLAVTSGGRLHQHLPDVVGSDKHRPAPGVYGHHGVTLVDGSLAAEVAGDGPEGASGADVGGLGVGAGVGVGGVAGGAGTHQVEVNTYHHQAVADPGRLTVTGWADDGVIEAIEDPRKRFVLGVQWHPEEGGDLRAFQALVRAAAS